jgi:hypothetical protein
MQSSKRERQEEQLWITTSLKEILIVVVWKSNINYQSETTGLFDITIWCVIIQKISLQVHVLGWRLASVLVREGLLD